MFLVPRSDKAMVLSKIASLQRAEHHPSVVPTTQCNKGFFLHAQYGPKCNLEDQSSALSTTSESAVHNTGVTCICQSLYPDGFLLLPLVSLKLGPGGQEGRVGWVNVGPLLKQLSGLCVVALLCFKQSPLHEE